MLVLLKWFVIIKKIGWVSLIKKKGNPVPHPEFWGDGAVFRNLSALDCQKMPFQSPIQGSK